LEDRCNYIFENFNKVCVENKQMAKVML